MSMTIGAIKSKLRGVKGDCNVCFDFCGCTPTRIDSYRGHYDRPAVGWKPTGYSSLRGDPPTKLVEFMAELRLATQLTYRGWKGGEYQYCEEDVLYVDNPGDYSSVMIVDIRVDEHIHSVGGLVTLVTRQEA